ncbi:MAG: hypothetical protein ACRD1G_11670, partial [Acidimicrobiales bacterium]
MSSSVATEYGSLRSSVVGRWLSKDVLRVSGPEALVWLQGQLSQDVESLPPGGSSESLLLSPKGKIDAYLRVTRLLGDALLLDVQGGWGAAVHERLARFKL